MSSFSRGTVPQWFLDIISMALLVQPEPEYFHAGLFMNSLNVALDTAQGIGLPIPGRVFGTEGGALSKSFEEMQLMLNEDRDPAWSDAIMVVPELGKQVGHTIKINRPKFENSTYSRAARRAPVGKTFSTTPIGETFEQAQITIDRFAGPYSNDQADIAPYGFERFDASRSLIAFNEVKKLYLVRDWRRTIDAFGVSLFDQVNTSTGIIRPGTMTADNDSVLAGDFPMSYAVLTEIEDSLKSANIPRFENGKYMLVLHPRQVKQLKRDAEYQRLATYHQDYNPLFKKNYVSSIEAFDIFESTTLTSVVNSNSVRIYYGQAFGPGMVGAGVGMAPEVRHNTQDNYGETGLLIWLAYLGLEVLDDRFGRRITTS